MIKNTYQLPPHTFIELLHSNVWWQNNIELIDNGFTYAHAHKLYRKGIFPYMDNIWESECHTFLSWDEAQMKFQLAKTDNEDWITLTSKIINKWRHMLEKNPKAKLRQWVGFHYACVDDPAFVA